MQEVGGQELISFELSIQGLKEDGQKAFRVSTCRDAQRTSGTVRRGATRLGVYGQVHFPE
jgi:hypothetical protein